MLLSLSALAFAAIFGITCVLSRLRNFRGTARRARNDPNAPAKESLDDLGRVTWFLFYALVITFALGVAALAVALLLTYGGKLV
jgi:hypothetical protein